MAVEVGRGTEENKEGSNAGRPSAGDPETDAFIYTSGQTEQLGNALDESKEGSPGSRTETSREDVASGIGYFNKMNNKTSEMQSEWEARARSEWGVRRLHGGSARWDEGMSCTSPCRRVYWLW